jgi:nicotinamidase-related amidase
MLAGHLHCGSRLTVAACLCLMATGTPLVADEWLEWQVRWQRAGDQDREFRRVERNERWPAERTAFIVCDVWDAHHSINAVRRLEQFIPRLEAVLQEARRRGAVIIHAPSDCMPAYHDHPARLRAIQTSAAPTSPLGIEWWCSRIPAEEQADYPIDQSDGGEDDDPVEHAAWAEQLRLQGRNPALPWQRQADGIQIDSERDYLTDRGDEVWNILTDRGIDQVVLTGVHANMCVLGRPFGLRQMARAGKRVVLMRDLTDSMYNPARWPFVDHFTGHDLVISHIERYVCPTVTSDQLIGGAPFRFAEDTRTQRDVMQLDRDGTAPSDSPPRWLTTVLPLPPAALAVPSSDVGSKVGFVEPIWCRATLLFTHRTSVPTDTPPPQQVTLCIDAPAGSKLDVWLEGEPLEELEPIPSAAPHRSDQERASVTQQSSRAGSDRSRAERRWRVPTTGPWLGQAALLVIRQRPEPGGTPAVVVGPPPRIEVDGESYPLDRRWQIRLGDGPDSTVMPLPTQFGTATDIIYELPVY